MDLPPRTICRKHEFKKQLGALIQFAPDADEFIMAAEISLAVEPTLGLPAPPDGKIWVLAMPPVQARQVSLYYSFNEETVTFEAILAFED